MHTSKYGPETLSSRCLQKMSFFSFSFLTCSSIFSPLLLCKSLRLVFLHLYPHSFHTSSLLWHPLVVLVSLQPWLLLDAFPHVPFQLSLQHPVVVTHRLHLHLPSPLASHFRSCRNSAQPHLLDVQVGLDQDPEIIQSSYVQIMSQVSEVNRVS